MRFPSHLEVTKMQDLSAHIMDIAQNSVRAEATKIEIDIEENIIKDLFSITIRDNGCGMDAETLDRVTEPFFTSRTVRRVGLGIPLLKQNAEQTGGSLTISSREGEGTTIQAIFSHSHLDRPPVGNIANTVVLLVASNPDIRFVYRHVTEKGKYLFDSKEVKDFLEGVPVNDPEIVLALQQMIEENLKEITYTTNQP